MPDATTFFVSRDYAVTRRTLYIVAIYNTVHIVIKV